MFKIGDKVKIKKSINRAELGIMGLGIIQDAKKEVIFTIIEKRENNRYVIEELKNHYKWCVLEENLILLNKENNMEFTKSDLKDGMVVELRNGMKFLYMDEQLIGKDIYSNLELHYNDNLLNLSKTKLDIIKVYDVNWGDVHFLEDIFNNLILIWKRKRKEYPKLTRYELESLKRMMTKGYSDIARDKDKTIVSSTDSLEKGETFWYSTYGFISNYIAFSDDFKFIKWTDEEPWNIQELLENCEMEN